MKNVNYIINGITVVAVIVLFVLYFTEKKPGDTETVQKETTFQPGEHQSKIAYFKIDSVFANWDLYFSEQEKLSTMQQKLETDFENKSQGFRKRVEDAQYKIQRGLVTRAEAQQLEQQLAAEEQNLVGLQNDYAMQLQEESTVSNRQMVDNLEQYLKKYNADKGYDYIFSYSFGGNLFYGNKVYDITEEVIKGVNEAYPAK